MDSKKLATDRPTCFTCEHLNDEDICEIKGRKQDPDAKCCRDYEYCGYDITLDSNSLDFCY